MPLKPLKIGILGGMGPAASAELYARLIRYCQKQYGCVQDTDFPPIFVNSIGLEGFDETGVTDVQAVLEQLKKGLNQLESVSDVIVMACNTVHLFYESLQKECRVPILSVLEMAAQALRPYRKIGLLASETTRTLGLYEKPLKACGIGVISPSAEDQKRITAVIKKVMGGTQTEEDGGILLDLSEKMLQKGAEAILVGCTELPLAMPAVTDFPVYDTLQLLAESAADQAMNKKIDLF